MSIKSNMIVNISIVMEQNNLKSLINKLEENKLIYACLENQLNQIKYGYFYLHTRNEIEYKKHAENVVFNNFTGSNYYANYDNYAKIMGPYLNKQIEKHGIECSILVLRICELLKSKYNKNEDAEKFINNEIKNLKFDKLTLYDIEYLFREMIESV